MIWLQFFPHYKTFPSLACFYPVPRKSAKCTLLKFNTCPYSSPPIFPTPLVDCGIWSLGWRHTVPSKNHYWYHCKNKPATKTMWRGWLASFSPNCMLKNKPLLILNICQMSHTLGYFFIYLYTHNISNWKQHLNGFKTINAVVYNRLGNL